MADKNITRTEKQADRPPPSPRRAIGNAVISRPTASRRPSARRLQPEYVQDRRRRGVLELGSVLQDEERLLRTHEYGHVLLSVDRIADGRSIDPRADTVAPDLLQGFGVVGRQRAVGMPDEGQVAGGRKRAAAVGIFEPEVGLGLSRGGIERLEAPIETFALLETAAREALARLDRAALVDEI